MLTIKDITYIHPDKEILFQNLSLSLNKGEKLSLTGNNGTGKSTLLKLIAGILSPSSGTIITGSTPFYVPQHTGQFDNLTLYEALGIEVKIKALKEILNGDASTEQFEILNDDWDIEERCLEALKYWQIDHLSPDEKLSRLSGGEKSRLFLAGIDLYNPEIILFDEPSNHLDLNGREKLYELISSSDATILAVSHDRTLLNLMNRTAELDREGIKIYGGNYEFYKELKEINEVAIKNEIAGNESRLRKTKTAFNEAMERKNKSDARAKSREKRAGTPLVMIHNLKDWGEKSSSKLKEVHTDKIAGITDELKKSREKLNPLRQIKTDFGNSSLHHGKVIAEASGINYDYGNGALWNAGLSFIIKSGDRVSIEGANGSGKTTLINLLLGKSEPTSGILKRNCCSSILADQDYSAIQNGNSVMDTARNFNSGGLEEHEIKIRLNRYLFGQEDWDKKTEDLSGGEKMRLLLCCLMINNNTPDLFILDEPTNNLDIANMEILTLLLSGYQGTLIVVSHDKYFLNEIGLTSRINLN